MIKNSILFLSVIFCFDSAYGRGNHGHLLGVGQGISNPTSNSTINYSNGFTSENPVGVTYQEQLRITGQLDTGDDSNGNDNTGYGGELGFGNGTLGIAGGYYTRDCDNCEDEVRGAVGLNIGSFALGVGFGEDVYSAGFIVNPNGTHRFGVTANLNDEEGDDNNISTYGVGYTYFERQFAFTIDASKIDYENDTLKDDAILLSPGLAFFFNRFSFAITYDTYLEDDRNRANDLWFGLGIGDPGDWYVTIYHDYVNDWAFTASFYF